jgi:hypothetical protein
VGHWRLTSVILATQETEITSGANSSRDSIKNNKDKNKKKTFMKKSWWNGSQGVGPEFKPVLQKKKKKKLRKLEEGNMN